MPEPLVGTVLTLPGAATAELLAEPFDVVWVDLEHGALGPLDAQELILGAQAAGVRALVRLPADAHALQHAMLDAGADGVVLAGVEDAAQARAACAGTVHPPEGTRGWGPRRLALRGRSASAERRGGRAAPVRPTVWAQVESVAGVERAAAIAAVPGVDALVVGTADLSFALGVPLDNHAPELAEAIARVREAAAAADTAFGVAGALDTAPAALRAGAAILVHSTDARLCARAVDDAAAWLRSVQLDQEDRGSCPTT